MAVLRTAAVLPSTLRVSGPATRHSLVAFAGKLLPQFLCRLTLLSYGRFVCCVVRPIVPPDYGSALRCTVLPSSPWVPDSVACGAGSYRSIYWHCRSQHCWRLSRAPVRSYNSFRGIIASPAVQAPTGASTGIFRVAANWLIALLIYQLKINPPRSIVFS